MMFPCMMMKQFVVLTCLPVIPWQITFVYLFTRTRGACGSVEYCLLIACCAVRMILLLLTNMFDDDFDRRLLGGDFLFGNFTIFQQHYNASA